MRQLNHFRWLLISLVFMAPVCWSSAAPLPNYEGWEITITGKETMTAKYHDDIAYPLDDECTVTHSGTAKYRVTRDPERGAGMESYSVELVSSNAQIEVTGQGKAVLEVGTKTWTYSLTPGVSPNDWPLFCPGAGGKNPSPDEPTFLFNSVSIGMHVSGWEKTPDEGGSPAEDLALRAWEMASGGEHPLRYDFPHRLDADHLTASGSRTYDYKEDRLAEIVAQAKIVVTYNVVLTPKGAQPQPPPVELDEIDKQWLPQEGNTIEATMRVGGGKTADAFRFTLYDVSREPGTCANSQDANTDPDLTFSHEQGGWFIVQQTNATATSNHGGTEGTVEIACHDWGAWGKLKGEAQVDGAWQPAKVKGSGLAYVRLPYDDDDDHIADAWQDKKGRGRQGGY